MNPIRELPGELHTPDEAQVPETPEVERTDRKYVPPGTPRSRRELRTDTEEPPMIRSRTRLQMEPDVGEAKCERLITPHPRDLPKPGRNVARNYGRGVEVTQNSILYQAHTSPAARRLALVQ
jgi:hypothetical protein